MKILVSGAGVAGPCLAYWLERHGFSVTLVERAPALRTGGYIIDFWGSGFDVAERMGILPRLLERGYRMVELRQVDRDGHRVCGFTLAAFDRVTKGRFTSLPRSELAAAIYDALGDRVETIFDESIVAIDDRDGVVHVELERTGKRDFDLVVGADGLHSQVRGLTFGDADRYETYLGLKVAAFESVGYRPRDELVYMLHPELGQQLHRLSLRDDRTMFLLTFADEDPTIPHALGDQKALLHARFEASGWEARDILAALDETDALYLDRVSQVRMERWSSGRVVLVGDAASCPSLLAGQGSALAMAGAYVLAGELKRATGAHEVAFAEYERRLGSFIAGKQEAAIQFSSFFAPRSRLGLFVRNQVMRLMSFPFVSELAVGRELRDVIDLPEY